MCYIIPKYLKSSIVLIGLFFACIFTKAQTFWLPSDTLNIPRKNTITTTHLGLGLGSLTALSYAWYKDARVANFHWFNDLKDWRGMDKVGHAYSAYQLLRFSYQSWKWSGLNHKKSMRNALFYSLTYMSFIEVLDGFSENWGASIPDALANFSGAGLYLLHQQSKNVGLHLKYSFKKSTFSQYRPELLGASTLEQLLKDYNGQNYWISINDKKGNILPKWLALSFGYGASGMTGGSNNVRTNANGDAIPAFNRISRYSISLDILCDQFEVQQKWLKNTLAILSIIKVPFPTISYYSNGNFQYYWYR